MSPSSPPAQIGDSDPASAGGTTGTSPPNKAVNFAKLAMQRAYAPTPTVSTGMPSTNSAATLPSIASSAPSSTHSIESAPEVGVDKPSSELTLKTTHSVVMNAPGSLPAPILPATVRAHLSLSEFMRHDRHPRRQRKHFVMLQRIQETYVPAAKLAPVKQVRKEKKSDSSTSPGNGAMNKITSLLGKKKTKSRTTSGLLHMVRVSIMEERQDTALNYLDQLTASVIKKKRVDEVNHLFLLAMSKRMERLCMKLYEKGYPVDVNAPIFAPNVAKGEVPKVTFPSFFLLTIGFGLPNLALAMIKKANLAQSWYGLTPLLLAASIPGSGGPPLVAQLLHHGANPAVGIPLEQYLVHKKLRVAVPPRRANAVGSDQPPVTPISMTTPFLPPLSVGSGLSSILRVPGTGSNVPSHSPSVVSGLTHLTRNSSFTEAGQLLATVAPTSAAPIPQPSLFPPVTTDAQDRFAAWAKDRIVYPLDVAAATEQAETVLLLVCKMDQKRIKDAACCFVMQQSVGISLHLWKNGANAMQRDWGNMTGLHIATRMGLLDLVYVYLEMKVDVNTPGENGWYFLLCEFLCMCIGPLNFLLPRTPLHEAVANHHRDVARFLVRRGARTDATTSTGETVTDLARRAGLSETELAEYLSSTDATDDEQQRESAIADRIHATLLASPIASAATSTDALPSVRPMTMPRASGLRHQTSGMSLPDGSEAPPASNVGATTGGNRKRAESSPVPAQRPAQGRPSTLGKLAMLRTSLFNNSTERAAGPAMVTEPPSPTYPAATNAPRGRLDSAPLVKGEVANGLTPPAATDAFAEQPVHAAHHNLLNAVARMAGTVYETLQDQFVSAGRGEIWDQLYKILIRVDAAMTVGDAITQLVRLEMSNAVLFNAVRQLARLASAVKKLSWATHSGQQLPAVGRNRLDAQAEPTVDVEEVIWTEAAKDFDVQLKQLRDLDGLTDDELAAALRLRSSDRLEALAAVDKVLQKPSIDVVSKHLPRVVGAQVIVLDAQLRRTARRIQVTLEQAVSVADRAASSARTTQLDHLAVTAHEFIVDQEPFARGGFAELYRAVWLSRDSEEVVMKRLLPSAVIGKTMRDDLAKEARAWAAVHHEHVLPLLGVCLTANAPFLITPYMPNGTLVEYAETRPKEHARLLLEVSLGMAHIHRCGVAHGDLKGNNVLVDADGIAKVADFGLARFAADASRTTQRKSQGPVRWLAPERLEPGNKRVYEPDVFAFAMLCYEVVAGRVPFYDQPNDVVVLAWVQRGDRPTAPTEAASYSSALWDVVTGCWSQNPAARPSFCTIAGMLHALVPGAPPLPPDVAAGRAADIAAKCDQRERELCAKIDLLEKSLNEANARAAQVEKLEERVRDATARVAQVEKKARQDEDKRSAEIDHLEKRARDADSLARRESDRAMAAVEHVRDAEARAVQAESRARRESERADMAVAAADLTKSPEVSPLRALLDRFKRHSEQPTRGSHHHLLAAVVRLAVAAYKALEDQLAAKDKDAFQAQLHMILSSIDALVVASAQADAITRLVRLNPDRVALFGAAQQLTRLASAIKDQSWSSDLALQLPGEEDNARDKEKDFEVEDEEMWAEAAKDLDKQLQQLHDLEALKDDDLSAALPPPPQAVGQLEALAAVDKVLHSPSIAVVSKQLPRAVGAQVHALDAQLRQTARRIEVALEQTVPAADRAAMAARAKQLGHFAVTAHDGHEAAAVAVDLGKNAVRDELVKEACAWTAVPDRKHVLLLLGMGIAAGTE
ncbi:hypothetical protein GGF32_001609 [Allomyces javanicus]|nr:hypothetical protein GGF32_001609 [Allomyces javanicus]